MGDDVPHDNQSWCSLAHAFWIAAHPREEFLSKGFALSALEALATRVVPVAEERVINALVGGKIAGRGSVCVILPGIFDRYKKERELAHHFGSELNPADRVCDLEFLESLASRTRESKVIRQSRCSLGRFKLSSSLWTTSARVDPARSTITRMFSNDQRPAIKPRGQDRYAFDIEITDIELSTSDVAKLAIAKAEEKSVSTPLEAPPPSTSNGRPPKYDWDAFWRQVVVAALHPDGLPEVQADLVKQMLEWCTLTWDREPGESTIKDKLSPLYARQAAPKSAA